MGVATLAALIGRAVTVTVDGTRSTTWQVHGTVTDARETFGRVDLLIAPDAPTLGEAAWISADRVRDAEANGKGAPIGATHGRD